MSYQSFEELQVWQKARVLKQIISKLTDAFPPDEKYRLKDQMIRASRSVGTQIAEGHGRRTVPDTIRFCIISRGSLSELKAHLYDAFDEQYISQTELEQEQAQIEEVEKILNGYIHWLDGKAGHKK